jgi:hypothetical protein
VAISLWALAVAEAEALAAAVADAFAELGAAPLCPVHAVAPTTETIKTIAAPMAMRADRRLGRPSDPVIALLSFMWFASFGERPTQSSVFPLMPR